MSATDANFQDWNHVILRGPSSLNKVKEREDAILRTSMKSHADALRSKLDNATDVGEVPLPSVKPEIKKLMQQARNAKGMTQQQLAEKLNVTKNVINDYESGKVIPNPTFLAKIGRILGVKLNV